MTIKIEFPSDRKDIALVIGKALTEIGQGAVTAATAVDSFSKVVEEAPESAPVASAEDQPDPNVSNTDQPATQEQKAAGAHVAGDAVNLDEKGVPFNPEFCGKATIPFYGSGKKKGQWKKRQGVDEDAYDEWYADALLGSKVVEEGTTRNETTSDSNVAANAFGERQQDAASESVPQDAGQLMKWVSEQQAASNITQQQVTDAYTALQLPFDAIMNPAYPVAQNCAAIYSHLKGQIG